MGSNSCCFGCTTLRAGTLFILYIHLIGWALYAVLPIPQNSKVRKQEQFILLRPTAVKIITSISSCVVLIYALVGVYRRRYAFLIPFLIWWIAEFVHFVVVTVTKNMHVSFSFAIESNVEKARYAVTFPTVIFSILKIYFFIIVYYYYKDLKKGNASSSAA